MLEKIENRKFSDEGVIKSHHALCVVVSCWQQAVSQFLSLWEKVTVIVSNKICFPPPSSLSSVIHHYRKK